MYTRHVQRNAHREHIDSQVSKTPTLLGFIFAFKILDNTIEGYELGHFLSNLQFDRIPKSVILLTSPNGGHNDI